MTSMLRATRTLLIASLCAVSLHVQADPVPNTWSLTGSLPSPHDNATLTLLQSGEALSAAGCSDLFCHTPTNASATYDPATGLWTAAGNLGLGRSLPAATLLANGQVLVSGGCANTSGCTGIASSELYDPNTRQWTGTGAMNAGRREHVSVRLLDGRVLVTGGIGRCDSQVCNTLSSTEIYDPQSGQWTMVASMPTKRVGHVGVTLIDGRVLVVGGCQSTGLPCGAQSAVVYDPATNQWSNTGPVIVPRTQPTATLLPSGAVIVGGGLNSGGFDEFSVEAYDPAQNTWSAAGGLVAGRFEGSATLLPTGQVLFAGGGSASAELYDPTTAISSPTASMSTVRSIFGLLTLNTGDALAAGGVDNSNNVLASAELYHPGAGPLANVQPPSIDFGLQERGTVSAPGFFTVTNNGGADLIIDSLTLSGANPEDFVAVKLCAGGVVHPGANCRIAVRFIASGLRQRSAALDIHDNAPDSPQRVSVFGFTFVVAPNQWAPGGNMSDGREQQTSTLLADRRVLVAGGSLSPSADVYDSTTGTWQSTGPMQAPRHGHTATLLLDGRVLVAGGGSPTAELYDPVSNTWSATGSMSASRRDASAARLPDGRVLVSGGCDGNACTAAEIFDPASGQWSATGPMNVARVRQTATMLFNGRVLVAGGTSATAELYDANAGTWTLTGSMAVNRSSHAATRLNNGRVLVTGGCGGEPCRAVEVYLPATGLWTRVHDTNTPRVRHAATLLADGRVLVEGGTYFCDPEFGFCFTTDKAEIYNPASDTWMNIGRLLVPREQHTAIRLHDGRVLVTGGDNDEQIAPFNSTEIFTP